MSTVAKEVEGEYGMQKSPVSVLNDSRKKALTALGSADWIALLLGRLSVGLLFLSTGWGKVHNIPKVVEFFRELGIPAPEFHAVLVGYSELLCGAALVIGLFSRLATIPLIVSMIVAMLTALRDKIHGVFDLVEQSEFTYLVVLIMIAVLGPGRAAVDHFVQGKLDAIDD